MKNLLLIVAILFSGMLVKAQDLFFPTKEGTVLEYKTFDPKDKETGMVRYTITYVNSSGENMDITYVIESMDPNEKTVFSDEITIHKKGDKLYADMNNFINRAAFQQSGEAPIDVEITGNEMEIPMNLEPGDFLPDANVEMSMKVGFENVKMETKVTDRKVESFENIDTKAGNFDVYNISSMVTSNGMGVKTSSKLVEWYAKGVGLVKSENYDKNGNLNSYTELVAIR